MDRFKKIILPMQGHSKSDLHWLYNTRSENEPPLVFNYSNLEFWFEGTSYRSSEKMLLNIRVPADIIGGNMDLSNIACETYFLHLLYPIIEKLSFSNSNINKNFQQKAHFEMQRPDEHIVRRSGIQYSERAKAYTLRINFSVPLVNSISVNSKATIRAIRSVLDSINEVLANFDYTELEIYIKTQLKQQEVREYMKKNELCSFVANGSILPREGGTALPLRGGVPFVSPKEMEVVIPLSDGTQIIGMGIKRGITVITGGGYSGKSTLLDAIEMGIYNHVPGDGREFVLTDESALKIYAEDGRPITNLDLSPFFKKLPGCIEFHNFSTLHASGSVSQAANIIEAVSLRCKLLLLDEDKSATNFMIRDQNMRLIIKNDPIIPFTDRIRELYQQRSVSTILVIGGSSEYLAYADEVVLMDNYLPHVITEEVKCLKTSSDVTSETIASWAESRFLVPNEATTDFMFFKSVKTENQKIISVDKYSSDISFLTSLVSNEQLNTLACVIERLLIEQTADSIELLDKVETCIAMMFSENSEPRIWHAVTQQFYTEIRPIDACCCINRMRGLLLN